MRVAVCVYVCIWLPSPHLIATHHQQQTIFLYIYVQRPSSLAFFYLAAVAGLMEVCTTDTLILMIIKNERSEDIKHKNKRYCIQTKAHGHTEKTLLGSSGWRETYYLYIYTRTRDTNVYMRSKCLRERIYAIE